MRAVRGFYGLLVTPGCADILKLHLKARKRDQLAAVKCHTSHGDAAPDSCDIRLLYLLVEQCAF